VATRILRKVVKIDEEKCNGCGACVPACAEGALQIIDGKARLVSDKYCDGLGACLGECPQEAITIEEREAEGFSEEEAKHHLHEKEHPKDELPCGCSGAAVTQLSRHETVETAREEAVCHHSMLRHWPVQLTLVLPGAPFLQGDRKSVV
jgi:MinD superfamily P-loop ATPase